MRIKIREKKGGIDVCAGDRIMFNGSAYVLLNHQISIKYDRIFPTISHTEFNRLLKAGFVEYVGKRRTRGFDIEYDLYQFVEKKIGDENEIYN